MKLLINEPPVQVLPTLALKIGLHQAIVLQQLHYWLQNPKVSGIVLDDAKWIKNSYQEWQETNFPFWSVKTVQRLFASLEEMGLVLSDQIEGYDREKIYTIDYAALEALISNETHAQEGDETNCPEASGQTVLIEEDKVSSSLNVLRDYQRLTPDALDATLAVEGVTERKRKEGRAWRGRDAVPEAVSEVLDVYVRLSGQEPTKAKLMDWLQTAEEWLEAGALPRDVERAWGQASARFAPVRPGSITNFVIAAIGERKKSGAPIQFVAPPPEAGEGVIEALKRLKGGKNAADV